ncbi:MAG: hypothetical protein JJT89_00525 [Nitriliruptoraceae bacterium]|nr:hypothetical protein [Nitriliruptoraceae bacterium]
MSAPVPLIRHGAVIEGLPAAILSRLATDAHRQGRFDRLPEPDRARMLAAVAALHAAAEGWRTSVVGNAETAVVDASASSGHVDIAEAARMLNLSQRQVRNLAPDLGGVQAAGRWLLDADAVTAEAARRNAA